MNKKELQNKIESLKIEIHDLEYGYTTDNECVKLFKLFKEAEEKYKKSVNNYRSSNKPIIEKKYNELCDLNDSLKELSDDKKYKPSPKILEWFDKYTRGIDYGKIEVFWSDGDEQFVIIKNYGGSCWSGIGMRSYSPTRYWVSNTTKFDFDNRYFEFEGRMNKDKMTELINKIQELKSGVIIN
jgi:hypothetical protein